MGDRIYLKLLLESDIDDRFVSWFDDHELARYYSGSQRLFTRESIVADVRNGRDTGRYFVYGVFARDINLCIGTVKIGWIIPEHKISDLVVFIGDRTYLGKGYGAEAIRVGTKLAFERYDFRKLTGGIFEDNVASIRAYIAAGWVKEGQLQSHYWVDGKAMDRVLVSCFNETYFPR